MLILGELERSTTSEYWRRHGSTSTSSTTNTTTTTSNNQHKAGSDHQQVQARGEGSPKQRGLMTRTSAKGANHRVPFRARPKKQRSKHQPRKKWWALTSKDTREGPPSAISPFLRAKIFSANGPRPDPSRENKQLEVFATNRRPLLAVTQDTRAQERLDS